MHDTAAIRVFQPESASAGAPLRGVPTALRPPRDRPQPRAAAGHRDRGRNRSRPTYRLLVVRALAGADSGLTALLTDAVQRLANEVAGWGHHDAAGQVGARQLECGHLVARRPPGGRRHGDDGAIAHPPHYILTARLSVSLTARRGCAVRSLSRR